MWWVQWKHQGVAYAESLRTPSKEHAVKLLREKISLVRAAIVDGTFGKRHIRSGGPLRSGREIPLSEAWERYRGSKTRKRPSAATLTQYTYQFDRFREWLRAAHPNAVCLSDVTKEVAWQFMEHLKQSRRLSPNTYNKYADTLDRVFGVLNKDAGLEGNPWGDIAHMSETPCGRKEFTLPQIRLILGKATGWMRTLFLIGLHTGQRLGDCCQLTFDKVHFDRNLIEVVPAKTRHSSRIVVELPMHPELRRHLEQVRGQPNRDSLNHVMPEVAER